VGKAAALMQLRQADRNGWEGKALALVQLRYWEAAIGRSARPWTEGYGSGAGAAGIEWWQWM